MSDKSKKPIKKEELKKTTGGATLGGPLGVTANQEGERNRPLGGHGGTAGL